MEHPQSQWLCDLSHFSQNGYQENHDKDTVTSLRRQAGIQVGPNFQKAQIKSSSVLAPHQATPRHTTGSWLHFY